MGYDRNTRNIVIRNELMVTDKLIYDLVAYTFRGSGITVLTNYLNKWWTCPGYLLFNDLDSETIDIKVLAKELDSIAVLEVSYDALWKYNLKVYYESLEKADIVKDIIVNKLKIAKKATFQFNMVDLESVKSIINTGRYLEYDIKE